ncbi:hypothetical protein HPP92_000029 [Vanilla planifolia]|uniref:Cyanate lyase C-terminal domain-containing protein n=1 Tax=Vanilla planifolia TaxID=51239 RepID=A0A835VFK0_VANPL|nr:hypothetical protein HPP92_000029 [Vanilla planifolia]
MSGEITEQAGDEGNSSVQVPRGVVAGLMTAKLASGKTCTQIAAETGPTNVYVAQLFRHQAQLKPDTAVAFRAAVPALTDDLISEMMKPLFRYYHPNLIQEPAICGLNEDVVHFGESIKEIINESCDGMLSLRCWLPYKKDFNQSLLLIKVLASSTGVDKVKGADGKDRVVITFDGKYLPYSEQAKRMDVVC